MTNTPLDLVFPAAHAAIQGIGLVLLVLALLWIRWAWKAPTRWKRVLRFAPLVALIILGPVDNAIDNVRFQRRLAASEALFKERCKLAGLRVDHTVEGVEGVVLMKWWMKQPNYDEQFDDGDVYGSSCEREDCITHLLTPTLGLELDPTRRGISNIAAAAYGGYRFVESVDPADGQMYRYVRRIYRPWNRDPKWLKTVLETELVKTPIKAFTARYGLTWEELSTREDREHWIAGSALRIVDLKTNQVIAEKVGFMIDKALGSRAGFRSPWYFAHDHMCPPVRLANGGVPWPTRTYLRDFSSQILHFPEGVMP